MEFFDKLSKKASETYQIAKEKTTNLSEELKLKSKINSLEEKNYQIFAEIGETVYKELKEGRDVEKDLILVKVDEVTANQNEMEKLKLKLMELKQVKKCVNCGAELEKNASFCSKCGTAQPAQEKVEVKPEPSSAKETEVIDVNNVEDKKEE
jgi:tRNA(Ile2) C34 agmatinyltransferase TiaS